MKVFCPFRALVAIFSIVWSHFEDFGSCEIKVRMGHLVQNIIDTAYINPLTQSNI